MEPYQIIKYPLSTEKAVRLMESENKLIFVVDIKARKQDVKKAIEEMFKVKVMNVNLAIVGNQKRAYIKLSPDNPAIEIATQLGLM